MPLPRRPLARKRRLLRNSGRPMSAQSSLARVRIIVRRHSGFGLGAYRPRRPEFLRGRAWGLWFLLRSFEQ